ncbi:YggS family pyridoxal phosphate-dependent enzyme [Virgibacillus flavescens]|uniref:YggS family pyridoxal phosphate-dependent enzyme n=1 Tax=Virgibacillus flavescens TaxID=1611422 RepID=UPI003D356FEA
MQVTDNLTKIKSTIENACRNSNRNPDEITIIGVTKYVTIERTIEAVRAGIENIGENRLEGFLDKYESLHEKVKWHFIGSLQSRKVKDVIDKIDYVHSLDRKSLAIEIDKRAKQSVNCFVQVNVSGENSKHGIALNEIDTFITTLQNYPNIKVVGLMTMAPHTENEEVLRETFQALREKRDQLRNKKLSHAPCEFLSMGMSNDFGIAVEEGATHIRIGSTLVGSKN